MLSDVADRLCCPVCGAPLAAAAGALRCSAGHCFDIARHGYVNLLPGSAQAGTADTPAMVLARADFLGAGHFAELAALVASSAAAGSPSCVLDAGAGTGYYLGEVLDRSPDTVGLALDVSKYAVRRAVRRHPRLGAVVCDVWQPLPVRTDAADVILNVFAPRNGPEFRRVLRPGGALLVVTPTARHLGELVGPLGLLSVDQEKGDRVAETLEPHFARSAVHECEVPMTLRHAEVLALVGMGPSARHVEAADLARRVSVLPDPVPVTASCVLSVYR